MANEHAVQVLLGVLALTTPQSMGQCQPDCSDLKGGADWFAEVRTLTTFDEGSGVSLFCGGGFFNFAGVPIYSLARWDGWRATPIEPEITATKDSEGVFTLLAVPMPHGGLPVGLYAGGAFFDIGGLAVHSLARWDGAAWHDVGGGLTSPNAVYGRAAAVFDEDGEGPLGPCLFVGGDFRFAGGVPAIAIARWNGKEWSALDGLLSTGKEPHAYASVYALAVYDDGRGPALYVGGSFYYADGKYAQNIARWDGQSWEQVGNDPYYGVTAVVECMAVYDEDGDGAKLPALFAGGQFSYADGKPTNLIARWNGNEWTAVGDFRQPGSVKELTVWKGPDDEHENLYAGGFFNTMPDGSPVNKIARWNGKEWRRVGDGVTGFGQGTQVSALGGFDEDGDGPNPGGLYVGGMFLYAGDVETHHIARWGCPLGPRCDADLDKSGSLDLFDFLAFLNLFNAEDPTADCTADGAFDLFDFLCFVNAFNAGC